MSSRLTVHQVLDADVPEWRFLLQALHARFRTPDYATGLRLTAAVGAAAEEQNHHPDLDLRYGHVAIRLQSHDALGVTERDLRLARTISALAAEMGATAAPDEAQVVEFALDTPERERIVPFWEAILGREYEEATADLNDTGGHESTVWFQRTDPADTPAPAEPRQRWHVDVTVPIEQAQARIDAALAAGGTLVSDDRAPAFWVLADADGNKACICTPMGR